MKSDIIEMNRGYLHFSGKVVVADPCHDRNSRCIEKDIAIKPGLYYATILASNKGVKCIMAVHCDFLQSKTLKLDLISDKIGVDSGQCGIFDDTIYPMDKKSIGKYDDPNTFYGECCKLTLSDRLGGPLENHKGIVSSSGGDGVYELYCQYHEGERVILLVNFVPGLNIGEQDSIFNINKFGFLPY